jgi:carbonic anhydrase
LVLGHTHCGAIKAALDGEGGAVAPITAKIADAIGDVSDPYEASVLNTRAAIHELQSMPELAHLIESHDLVISGAIYHTHSGAVDFLE